MSILWIKRLYFWAGLAGLLILLPLFISASPMGYAYPPVLAGQPWLHRAVILFPLMLQPILLAIGRDPLRRRGWMPAMIAEKLLAAAAVPLMVVLGGTVEPYFWAVPIGDALLGLWFAAAWRASAARLRI